METVFLLHDINYFSELFFLEELLQLLSMRLPYAHHTCNT